MVITGDGTHLCVLELLLDFVDEATTNFANKTAEEEFRTDLTRASDGPANAHQSPDLVRPQIANSRNKRQVIERDIELARLKVCRISCRSCRVNLEIIGLEFGDEVQEGATKVGEESVVLLLDGICENVIFLEEVAVVNVERSELVFTHGMNLLNINEFTICDLGQIAIGCRSRC
jgi:hypothetical protein